MGLRFRRSVKLLPGVRLNFSLSGVSATLGPRGASVNVGPRGTFANVGLGGGLSYRTRLSGGGGRRGGDSGATDARAAVADRRAALEAQLDAWRDAPPLIPRETFAAWRAPFSPPGPESPERQALIDESLERLTREKPAPAWATTMLLPLGAALAAGGGAWLGAFAPEVVGAAGLAPAAGLAWGQRRTRQAHAQALQARAEAEAEAAWPERLAELEAAHRARAELAARLLDGDGATMSSSLEAALGDLDFPFETSARFELFAPEDGEEPTVLRLAVDLPEIEDLVPETKLKAYGNGALREIQRPRRERYALWADTVTGVALAMARIGLRVLPRVEVLEIAGYTQRKRRGSSRIRDDVVYVKTMRRAEVEPLDLPSVDPVATLATFPGPFAQSSTGRVEPVRAPPAWVTRLLEEEA